MHERVDHYIFKEGEELLLAPDQLYGYIYGANGTFVLGSNEYFSAMIPVIQIKDKSRYIKGLMVIRPFVKMFQRVPAEILTRAIAYARLVYREGGHQLYVGADPIGNWVLSTMYDGEPITLHLHNQENGFNSLVRDMDMRIVGDVWNLAGDVPHIRLRIGIMAHQAIIPHNLVFEQGVEVIDA